MLPVFNGTKTYACGCHLKHNHVFLNRGMDKIQENIEIMKQKEIRSTCSSHNLRIQSRHQRWYASTTSVPEFEEGFEMAASNIRYGKGITKEVGHDVKHFGAKLTAIYVDPNVMFKGNSPLNVLLQSMEDVGAKYKVFSDIGIEPTENSLKKAIQFAQSDHFDCFVALGGGSTMDTCKAANLYSCFPPENFFDYVNPPIGKGLPPPGQLKPMIAIPTTAGTGSETTGVIIFDVESKKFKTGIAHRLLRPTIGIVDPNNTRSCPPNVIAASGFDVLCHSLESYTAMPYHKRARPNTPMERPAYQGSNPIADHWSLKSLELTAKYIVRAYKDPEDEEARNNMILATFAGIGFGNAGVHLCHGMSYPISGMAHDLDFHPSGYPIEKAMVPHGMSVVLNAPAVFRWTSDSDPERHILAAKYLGADSFGVKDSEAGNLLAESIIGLMKATKIPNGLKAIGYTLKDIPALVEGTLPQHRVIKLAPKVVEREDLENMFKATMEIY